MFSIASLHVIGLHRAAACSKHLVSVIALLAACSSALATELTAYAATSLKGALDEVAKLHSAHTGHKVVVWYGGSPALARINGSVLFDSGTRVDLPPEQRRVVYVFQDALLFPHLSVERNVFYGAGNASRGEQGIDAAQVIDLLGIVHLLPRRPATLSGGEKQRVAIGRALLANPRILLMDEPLASLDGERRHDS